MEDLVRETPCPRRCWDDAAVRRCRFCGAPLRARPSSTSAPRRSPTRTSSREQLRQPEPFYPLRRLRLRATACWCSCRRREPPEAIFTDYAYFSSYSESWLRARASATPTAMIDALRPDGPAARSSRSPATTATCCSYFASAGIPVLGIEPAANVAAGRPRRKGIPTLVALLRRRDRAASWPAEGRRPTCWSATTCWPTCPTSTTSSPGCAMLLAPRGVLTMEFPHLLRLIEREPVRHDLPRALLLLLARRRCERVFAAHGLTLFDVEELPTHGGSLRIYARHAEDESTRRAEPRSPSCCAREERAAGLDGLDAYRGFAERVQRRQARPAALPDRRPSEAGKTGRRLRRAGQGQHAAQLLRRPRPTFSTTRSIAARTSRDASCPARASRSTRPSAIARDPARLRADPALEPQGRDHRRRWRTSATGAAGSWCRSPRCGSSMMFTRDRRSPAPSWSSSSRVEDERGYFARTCGRRASSRARGLDARLAQCSVSFNHAARHPARACTTRRRRTRRPSWCAARAARSAT